MKQLSLLLLLVLSVAFGAQAQSSPGALHEVVENLIFSDPEKAEEVASREFQASQPNSKERVIALVDRAKCAYYQDRYDEGEQGLKDALDLAKKLNYSEGKAWALFHLGDLRILEGKYGSSIDYLNQSYQLFHKLDIAEGEALSLNAIGLIHLEQENFQKAQEYFKKALKTGNEITRGDSYTNLAELFLQMEAYSDANTYAKLALSQGKKNNDTYVQSTAYDVLGSVAMSKGILEQAQIYINESIRLKIMLADQKGAANSYLDLARIKRLMNQADSAHFYTYKAYVMADDVGAKEEIKDAAYAMSRILAGKGFYDSAFFYQNRFVQLNEELMNEQAAKKMAEMEAENQNKENQHRIQLLEKQNVIESEAKSFYLLLGIVGFIILSISLYFFYYRYQVKKRSFENLEAKNRIIQNQNHDILESIRYAKRLQEAILPDHNEIRKSIPKFFALYLPKDMVAGDFYWFEKVDGWYMLACCDSTGHGVPGAMVSVVCSNALNRAVLEMGLLDPAEILDQTRKLVVENFNKTAREGGDVKDGMDITFLAIREDLSKAMFAGAHHTLWIKRNGATEFEFIKGDKQPIGVHEKKETFTTHEVQLGKGDRLYMFTDGYADQFGGPQLKKLKNGAVREYLASIQDTALETQQSQLNNFFQQWKGTEEQVDDVTVLGLEV